MSHLAELLKQAGAQYDEGDELEKIAEDLYWQGRIIGVGIADELMEKEAGIKDFFKKRKDGFGSFFEKRVKNPLANKVHKPLVRKVLDAADTKRKGIRGGVATFARKHPAIVGYGTIGAAASGLGAGGYFGYQAYAKRKKKSK